LERVVVLGRGVDAERHDQAVRSEPPDDGGGGVERGSICIPTGSERQREVVRAAFSCSDSLLVGVAREERVLVRRVRVQ